MSQQFFHKIFSPFPNFAPKCEISEPNLWSLTEKNETLNFTQLLKQHSDCLETIPHSFLSNYTLAVKNEAEIKRCIKNVDETMVANLKTLAVLTKSQASSLRQNPAFEILLHTTEKLVSTNYLLQQILNGLLQLRLEEKSKRRARRLRYIRNKNKDKL